MAASPTLKRGAYDHCAYGARDVEINLVSRLDSCDCHGVFAAPAGHVCGMLEFFHPLSSYARHFP
jgi:hypothetical protein